MEKASLKIAFLVMVVLIIASSVPAGEAAACRGIIDCHKQCPEGGYCRQGKCLCWPSKFAEPSIKAPSCRVAECRAKCPPGMPGFCDENGVCRCMPSA
ncbi:hypothetical protein Tsubulata_044704 [Turnera subulata]|uniref:Uncharacterized protein n=1 Tax=Turnera subulata TaxID=218843 RepID=A0A9Q0FM95_9ROSI|nr:hypothetical protein Tsubulata_031528 [Turnera subulata]KAJ4834139.1 hypothetical protein Tsubulata_044704 [Turnera subulata]